MFLNHAANRLSNKMNESITKLRLWFCICFLFPLSLSAQEILSHDRLWSIQQIQNAENFSIHEFSGPNSPVYRGYEYLPNVLPATGNSFFLSAEWQDGIVCIDDKVYKHLPLLYDIYQDQLVLQSWNKIYRILLDPTTVQWFTIGAHYFIHIGSNDSLVNNFLPSGYYEELIRGPIMLIAKRIKTLPAPTSTGTVRTFAEKDSYYIRKGNRYYRVRSERSVLRVLGDHRKVIKQYLRKNEIRFNLDREAAMIAIIKYENLLNNSQE